MTYRDEFDEPRRGDSFLGRVGPKAAFFVVLIALSFMIGVVWKLYVGASGGDSEQNVPIVRADNNPFKVTPDDPGGMEIPHKDSTIFSSLNSDNDNEKKIENLLAEDDNEEPMPRSQLFAGLNTDANPDLTVEEEDSPLDQPVSDDAQQIGQPMEEEETPATIEEKIAEAEESEPVKIEAPKKVEPAVETKAAPEPVKEEPKPVPEPVKVVPAPAPVTTTASGDYFVQLASVKDSAAAEAEWKKLAAKYSALSGYAHRIEKADLGAKGTFYRIQAGPVSKDKATATCEAIKKITPGGCLVKKK